VALRETLLDKPNEFIVSRREYFTLIIAIVVSLIFIFNSNQPQIDAVRSWFINKFALVQTKLSWYRSLTTVEQEAASLRVRATELMLENSALREALLENHRLRRLLAFKERSPYPVVSARVIAKLENAANRVVEIDAGSSKGVKRNMAMVTPAGLAGRILETRAQTSTVQLLNNHNFKASARVQRSREFGIVEYQEQEGLVLTSVAKNSDIKPGDVVVTSEMSSIFPEGIRIGIVKEIKVDNASLFLDVSLEPDVNLSQLEEVFVVVAAPADSTN
jgi:rod shape-determining protein MreC